MSFVNPSTAVMALASTSSRLEKEGILKEVLSSPCREEFFVGTKLALDPLYTFGVGKKSVPEKKGNSVGTLSWNEFLNLQKKLASRELTGNAAIDAIFGAMKMASTCQWNYWYRRILLKNLDCGVSEKTINKIVEKDFPDFVVPVFSCQLAEDSAKVVDQYLSGLKQVESKLDGVRVITIVRNDGQVEMFSRNGKEILNFGTIVKEFEEVAKIDTGIRGKVFDGEIMSASFQDLMKQVYRKSDVDTKDAILNLFDTLPLVDFVNGYCKISQAERSNILNGFYLRHADTLAHVQVLGHEIVDMDTYEGRNRLSEINRKVIAGGYEGIMMKNPNSPYECKRSKSWLKMKPFISCTLEVTGIVRGTGKYSDITGALVCEGYSDCGKLVKVNVGSGLTDSLRGEIWKNTKEVLGSLVEIKADAITQSESDKELNQYSLRFPRFLGFREVEKGEGKI